MCVKHYVAHQRAIIRENILLVDSLVEVLGVDHIQDIGKPWGTADFMGQPGSL